MSVGREERAGRGGSCDRSCSGRTGARLNGGGAAGHGVVARAEVVCDADVLAFASLLRRRLAERLNLSGEENGAQNRPASGGIGAPGRRQVRAPGLCV